MEAYFNNQKKIEQFRTIIKSWIGTPYRHLCMVPKRGADCALFIASCFKDLGILKEVDHGYYSRDWHKHTEEEVILNSILNHTLNHVIPGIHLIEIDIEKDFIFGDLLGFAFTKTGVTHHVSIYDEENLMIHAAQRKGVCYQELNERYLKFLKRAFRFYSNGNKV